MKIGKLKLNYFKRFRELELDFRDEAGFPKDMVVLIGENGAGKTTILQAIAYLVSKATHQPFSWPGFEPELAYENWEGSRNTVTIDCLVDFKKDELSAIQEYYRLADFIEDEAPTPPGNLEQVEISYLPHYDTLGFRTSVFVSDSEPGRSQFRGRDFAEQALRQHPEGRAIFKRVGSAFWYTQHRQATSLTPWNGKTGNFDWNALRQRLSEWQNVSLQVRQGTYKLRPHQRDLYSDLEKAYERLFPGRYFIGSRPREAKDVTDPSWFFLSEGDTQYEISEMSAGEQAIFPILFDFVNWDINRSIILIDEVDLHLHPPLQQAFVRSLPLLGEDNQFIITTHSEDVLAAVPDDSIYRIEG